MYLVAQRLVTAAVTKHGPYSPGLLRSELLSEVGERPGGRDDPTGGLVVRTRARRCCVGWVFQSS